MTRRTATRRSWSGRDDLVVCVGGPRDGYWYTATDWQQRLDAAAHVTARSGQPAPPVDYHATDARMPHPHDADTTGRVLDYRPGSPAAGEPPRWKSQWCGWNDHHRCDSDYPTPHDTAVQDARCHCTCHLQRPTRSRLRTRHPAGQRTTHHHQREHQPA